MDVPYPIRVFHCDDSAAFTRLVRHWLAEHPELEHVGAVHTVAEALAAVGAARPHVVLLDTMGAPGDSSLLARIREAAPQARLIVYSGYLSLLDAGALGGEADAYLEKGDDEQALVRAIRAVVAS
ncbi:MAG: response regulator [Solirubrobacteraceae bacterium]